MSKARRAEIEATLVELERDEGYLTNLLEGTVIDASFGLGDEARSEYLHLRDAFSALSRSWIIWDIATSADVNRHATRSAASHAITRSPIAFDLAKTTEFDSEFEALHLQNANGCDLYLYPGLLAVKKPASGFAFLDMRDVDIRFTTSQFIEQEERPSDAEQVGHVWAKSNRDGSPDRRFANNYQIPLMRYGEIALSSRAGLNEVYMVSNAKALEDFAQALKRYSAALARSTTATESGSESIPFDQLPDLEISQPAAIPSIFSKASVLRLALLVAIAAIVLYVLRAEGMLAGV